MASERALIVALRGGGPVRCWWRGRLMGAVRPQAGPVATYPRLARPQEPPNSALSPVSAVQRSNLGGEPISSPFVVYVLELNIPRGGWYVGMTSNLEKRLSDHRAGRGAKVTKRYGVKSLVKAVPCSTREEALTLEQEITDELRADGWLVWGGKNCSPLRDGHFWVDD